MREFDETLLVCFHIMSTNHILPYMADFEGITEVEMHCIEIKVHGNIWVVMMSYVL